MSAEWLLLLLVVAGCAALLARQGLRMTAVLGILTLATLALGGAWLWQQRLERKATSRAELSIPRVGREAYAGSDSCKACHPNQYTSWHRSFHRTMTQVASKESVRGPFEKVTLELDGEIYRLEKRGEEFWVEMPDPDITLGLVANTLPSEVQKLNGTPRTWRRLSMVTGSHHMQAYWVDNKHGNQQFSFPFTYLFEEQRWVPRRSVFIGDPKRKVWAQIWNVGCIDCHSTAGQPFKEPAEIASFGTRVGELGIACEACHGPAGRHVRENSDPLHRYARHLRKKGDEHIVNPARVSPKRSAEVCGQCHSVHWPIDNQKWEREGERFQPGEELAKGMKILTTSHDREFRQSHFWNDGMIRVSGREYNGLVKSPCFQRGEMSCLSCHSMHESSPTNQLAKGMESNLACTQCHEKIGQKLEAHTHHAAGSTGSLCYNCHMPYTTYGLLKALRSHEISSPSVKTSINTGRPNACNLCHLDKTLDWTGQKLTEWYRQPVQEVKEKSTAASILWALQGDAGQRALIAWHMGWAPARAASGDDWFAPYLALLMQDDYSAVRYIAGRSLKQVPGFADFNYDYLAPEQMTAARGVYTQWSKLARAHARDADPSLLLKGAGQFDEEKAREVLKSQNRRVTDLNE